jgi:hypothetical protein
LRSAKPPPPIRNFLSHRDPGTVADNTQTGPRPPTAPVSERAAALVDRSEREQADEIHRRLVPTDENGAARVLFELDPGCHQFAVMGIPPNEQSATQGHDIDAELVWPDARTIAASDRSDSPDAILSSCVGERREAILALAGGSPRAAALVGHARWALPAGLPPRWGARARAGFARAFRGRRLQPVTEPPVYESVGISGTTVLPIETEPGACYALAVTALHGDVSLIVASVSAPGVNALAHGAEGEPALVSFCATSPRALVEAEVHGGALAWLAALWQVGRVPLGVPSP